MAAASKSDEAKSRPTESDTSSTAIAVATGKDAGRLQVNLSDLKSNYCNFFNANMTREEIVLNFGINHNWDRGSAGRDVNLLHRIILSPYAAKRVSDLLKSLIADYEKRYGELK
jgi:hypothetical protein